MFKLAARIIIEIRNEGNIYRAFDQNGHETLTCYIDDDLLEDYRNDGISIVDLTERKG